MKQHTTKLVTILGLSIALVGCSKKNKDKVAPKPVAVPTLHEPVTQAVEEKVAAVVDSAIEKTGAAEKEAVALDETVALPEDYRHLMKEGRVLLNKKDAKAVDYFAAAVALHPERGLPNTQYARALLLADESGEALHVAKSAVELDKKSSLAWNTLGRAHLAENDGPAAIAAFTQAVEEDSENSYAWNNLGYTLLLRGKYQEAAEALEEATSGGHVTQYMWNNLGLAYEHLDLIPDARSAYRQAAQSGSDKAESSLERLRGVVSLRTEETVGFEDFDSFQ